MTTEPNFAHCTYLEETWSFIDCPGSIELAQDVRSALMGVDVAVVVAPPEPARCLTLAPIFKLLDDHQIPHVLFVNRMDKAARSEERRVGKEWVRTCRARGSPSH